MSRILKHRSLAISAPEEIWVAFGWQVWSNCEEVGEKRWAPHMDSLLAEALIAGKTGEQCLAWASGEERRMREAEGIASALHSEAKAIQSLAASIQKQEEIAVLNRVMSSLSERTRFAIRKQLNLGE